MFQNPFQPKKPVNTTPDYEKMSSAIAHSLVEKDLEYQRMKEAIKRKVLKEITSDRRKLTLWESWTPKQQEKVLEHIATQKILNPEVKKRTIMDRLLNRR